MQGAASSAAGRGTSVIASALLLSALLVLPAAHGEARNSVVRLAVVNTPAQSGLLSHLLPAFEKDSGYEVQVYSGSDVFERARRGEADLVIAHWGKAGVEPFVASGLGLWPRAVFSNQSVLIGPKSDPARIRGMTNPLAAMRKIAQSGAPFVCAANAGARYMCELLLAGAGQPDRLSWYLETQESKGRAMRVAEEKGAYTVWGSFPFERYRRRHDTSLEVMVWETPVFHRVMATIVVHPGRFPGANVAGAQALENYLLSADVQAAVASFREAGLDRQTWWPAARNNDPARLPGVSGADDAED